MNTVTKQMCDVFERVDAGTNGEGEKEGKKGTTSLKSMIRSASVKAPLTQTYKSAEAVAKN